MRLGGQACTLLKGSLTEKLYAKETVVERHRHRYEVNNNLLPKLETSGLLVSARSEQDNLVEMIELPEHPWFIGCQFHPEFKSKPMSPHPLFDAFIAEARGFSRRGQWRELKKEKSVGNAEISSAKSKKKVTGQRD